jgi:hypothetical protein
MVFFIVISIWPDETVSCEPEHCHGRETGKVNGSLVIIVHLPFHNWPTDPRVRTRDNTRVMGYDFNKDCPSSIWSWIIWMYGYFPLEVRSNSGQQRCWNRPGPPWLSSLLWFEKIYCKNTGIIEQTINSPSSCFCWSATSFSLGYFFSGVDNIGKQSPHKRHPFVIFCFYTRIVE